MEKKEYRYKSQIGASLVEMALVVSLIAVVGMANVTLFGDSVSAKVCESAGQIENDGVNISTVHTRRWNHTTNNCASELDQGGGGPCPPGWQVHESSGGIISCEPPE